MNDTPRTDEVAEVCDNGSNEMHGEWADADFARQLERELNAANEKVKRLVKVGDEMENWMRNPRNLGGDPFISQRWQDAKEATR